MGPVLITLMALVCGVAAHAQCDYYSNLGCNQIPQCQDENCSLTPSAPPPGTSYTPPPPSGPSGPQSGPDNPNVGHQTAQQNEASALLAADAVITNSLTEQPAPGLDNIIVITNYPDDEEVGILVNDGRLPTLQARSTPRRPASLPHSEPVAGDGEFVVDETDLTLPGVGIPFVFSRHYRSGVDYQTPLGFGWNHSFNQRLVVAASAFTPPSASTTSPPDVFLINDRLEQLRFAFISTSSDGNDVYELQSEGTMTLARPHGVSNATWQLDDGSGLISRFDGTYGELMSIADAAGHTIRIAWSQGSGTVAPKVTNVTDTTGRVIYFVYQTVDQSTFWPSTNITWVYQIESSNPQAVDQAASVGPTGYEFLQCLSLTTTCDTNALVTFKVAPITATSDPVKHVWAILPYPYGPENYQTVNYTYEFDLIQVLDSTNNGPTYKYYAAPDETYGDKRLYVKEFDTKAKSTDPVPYWPSEYAQQLYQGFQKEIPALEAMCAGTAQMAVHEADTLMFPNNSLCDNGMGEEIAACVAKDVASLTKSCMKAVPDEVKALKSRISSVYRYGTPPQLYHNLTEIDDTYGHPIVQNTYGTDTSLPDFDRVNKQVLGGDSNNTTTYSYVDGAATGAFALESPFTTFYPVDVCPRLGASYGPIVRQPQLHSDGFQSPALEIISQGPLGRTASVFADANGEILRASDTAGVATNYNYSSAGPSGILYPNGQRSCRQYDGAGRLTAVSEIPSPGLTGDTVNTALTYDSSEELIDQTQTVGSEIISDRSILRDAVERVIGVADAVDAQHSRWTCYQYADAELERLGPTLQNRLVARVSGTQAGEPSGLPGEAVPVRNPFKLSPCALLVPLPPVNLSFATRAAIPSRVILPDGTVTELSNITPAGPGEMVVDATGAAPLDRYFTYDTFGRLNATGLRDFVTKQILPASVEKWDTYLEGELQDSYVPDATNPTQLLKTSYVYDKNRNLTSTDDPLLHRDFTNDIFGNVLSVTETPKGGPGASGTARSSCTTYNPYEQPTQTISPEGNVSAFTYDAVGQLTEISMGPELLLLASSTPASNAPCVAATASRFTENGVSPRETVAQFSYNANEQMSSASSNGTTSQYTYDGLGRLIDTYTPDHVLTQPVTPPLRTSGITFNVGYHNAVGYRGITKAWEAVMDSYPAGGALPAYHAPGIHAAIEYTYDLIGRPLEIKRWQFVESQPTPPIPQNPYGTATFVYDDAHNSTTITDPLGTVYFEHLDGADRRLESVKAQGLPEEIDTTYSYSNAGLLVNSVTTPAPTATHSLTRSETYSPRGTLLQIQEQGRTLLQRQLDSFGRVQIEQTPSDAAVTYAYDAFNQVVTTQHQSAPNSVYAAGTFAWNRDGNLLTTLDGVQHETIRGYDVLGRLQTLTDGLGTTTYSYMRGTSLPSSIVSPAAKLSNTYNEGGRLSAVQVVDTAGRDVSGNRSFGYSPLGQITVATLSGTGVQTETVTLAYDSIGRRISDSDSLSPFTIASSYSPREESIDITSNAGFSEVDRTVDPLGRPLSLQTNSESQSIAQWQYANGGLSAINYAGGSVLTYGYDSVGHVVSETVANGATNLASVSLSFGSDELPHQSTLKVKSTSVQTNYFQTDNAGRVIAEQPADPGLSTIPLSLENSDVASLLTANGAQYTLDGAANWQSRTGPQPLNTVIDAANRYSAINGQTVENIDGGGIQSYQNQQYRWDGLNELTSAAIGSNSRQWRHDALGRTTIATDAQGNTTRFIWDGETLIGSMPNNQVQALTIHAGFTSDEAIALVTPNSGTSLLSHGPDESVFAVTDDKGTLLQAYSYSAFGTPHVWNSSNTSANGATPAQPYLFQGAFCDYDLSLYRMGIRTYSPAIGRFLSPDPIGQLGGLNLFAFVDNRPLAESDPTGTNGRPPKSRGPSQGRNSGFRFPTAGLGDKSKQLFFTNILLAPPEASNPIDFTWAPGFNVSPSDIAISTGRAAQLASPVIQVPFRAIVGVLGRIGQVAKAVDPDGGIGNTLMATPLVAGGVALKELEAGSLAAESLGELQTVEKFSMLSNEIGEVGKGLAIPDFLDTGGEVIAEEIYYEAQFEEGWVPGRVDLLGQRPGLLPNQFLYLEAKAGLNPTYTYVQRLWLQTPGFVPVRFYGPKAAQYLDINQIYQMQMEVFRYPFSGK